MSGDSIFQELSYLILLSKEGKINDKQFERLEHILRSDALARRYYFIIVNNELYLRDSNIINSIAERPYFDLSDLHQLAEYERNAPEVEIPAEKPQNQLINNVVHPPREKQKLGKFGIFTLINAAAMVLFFVFLRFVPDKERIEVATLIDQMGTKWSQPDNAPETGSRLWTNQMPLYLRSGIVKIQYDDGVDVLIEGPAGFEILRSGIYMEYGRLFSRVSDTGLGFIVQTPDTRFVDLGTEFGVQADVNGSAELHVIKGKVQLFAGPKEKAKSGFVVTQNQAMRYNAHNFEVSEIPIQKQSFVRSFDSIQKTIWRGQIQIDLADIVGGGDGFGSGKIGNGININSGSCGPIDRSATQKKGHSRYIPVSNPHIDGVFVFGGHDGICQVSTEEHLFTGFQPTSLKYGNYLINGSANPRPDYEERYQLRLKGQLCGTKDNPVINMHANSGITFDLGSFVNIGPSHADWKFTSKCGIADNSSSSHPEELSKADFYVLIDGQLRFEKKDIIPGQVADIMVNISPEDRFLTLITGEGSDKSIVGDWTLFARPMIVITE